MTMNEEPKEIWIRQWVKGGYLAVYAITEDAADGDPKYIRADIAEAKNKKLKEAFLGYASHDMDCPRNWPNNPEGRGCTCGFDEAKKGQ